MQINNFDEIALFNTFLGIMNYSKNAEQQQSQKNVVEQINSIQTLQQENKKSLEEIKGMLININEKLERFENVKK